MTVKKIVDKVITDIKESAAAQREIDKANFDAAKRVDPKFQEFMDADGIKEKAKVVARHLTEDVKK